MSDYRLQVLHLPTGEIVKWKPGADVETDLVDDLCDRLKARGVGLFKTEKTVLDLVREELADVLWELKKKVR